MLLNIQPSRRDTSHNERSWISPIGARLLAPRTEPDPGDIVMNKQRDHQLGMDRPITRRDFLDGAARAVQAVAAGSVLGGGLRLSRAAAQERPVEPVGYPPGLTGD
jgi:hypothetical protein